MSQNAFLVKTEPRDSTCILRIQHHSFVLVVDKLVLSCRHNGKKMVYELNVGHNDYDFYLTMKLSELHKEIMQDLDMFIDIPDVIRCITNYKKKKYNTTPTPSLSPIHHSS